MMIPFRFIVVGVVCHFLLIFQGMGAVVEDFQEEEEPRGIDNWEGVPAEGWSTVWSMGKNGGVSITPEVLTENPLGDNGAYLQVQIHNEDIEKGKAGALRRAYAEEGEIRYDGAHRIAFLFRLDSEWENVERIAIFDAPKPALAAHTTQGAATWQIRSQASTKNWCVWDQAKLIDTHISIVPGHIYQITLWIEPISGAGNYRVRIENLQSGESYESGDLRFYSDKNVVGGYLTFSMINHPGQRALFSLDQIEISPLAP